MAAGAARATASFPSEQNECKEIMQWVIGRNMRERRAKSIGCGCA
jgi:hypothetical protein